MGKIRAPPTNAVLAVPATLSWGGHQHLVQAMIDSGAAGDFLDLSLAKELGIPTQLLPHPQAVTALDGRPLEPGRVTEATQSLRLTIHQHQQEETFYLIDSPEYPVILGHPWLRRHNPWIDWSAGTILSWGSTCHLTCLRPSAPSSEIQESVDLSRVPSSYHQFKAVFSKSRGTSLPPHRPYDCAIELLPGSCPPRGRIFSLSSPERTAMDTYIKESLAAGIIRTSTSPAGAGFFFVGKKDGGLRPCIDYRGLNKITVRNRYPLPLMATAFELLQGASIFTKLDLRNAYHLVRIRQGDEWKTAFNTPTGHYEYLVMPFGLTNAPAVFQALINDVLRDMLNQFVFVYLDDILIFSGSLEEHEGHVSRVLQRLLDNHLYVKPEKCEFHVTQAQFLGFIITPGHVEMEPKKVEAVLNWPIPATVKEVQRFIGFANFYRRFITKFSSVVAPLTALTKGGGIKINWGSEAAGAFEELKRRFTSAPILSIPDPERPFVVEVDASEVGVGAILSQRGEDGKLHPCAFMSRRLSDAERNYHVGDRELLAVKLALEEWRHWLEGAQHPFQVLTDHKNLEYLQQAKRLNPRQADGPCFLIVSSFSCLTDPVPRMSNRMPCPEPTLPRHRRSLWHQLFRGLGLSRSFSGNWKGWCERLKPKSQTQEVVLRDACTSLNLPVPGSCSGVMSLPWHAIQEMLAHLTSSRGGFGGRPSRRTLRSMWMPAPCAARESLHVSDLRDCSIHYLFPVGHGRTFLLTLSRLSRLFPSWSKSLVSHQEPAPPGRI